MGQKRDIKNSSELANDRVIRHLSYRKSTIFHKLSFLDFSHFPGLFSRRKIASQKFPEEVVTLL